MDGVPPSMPKSLGVARSIICADNDVVLKIFVKGTSHTFRHVRRTQRVDTDFVHDVIKDDSVSPLYVNTRMQISDMFTKRVFAIPQWKGLCDLAQVRPTPILCYTTNQVFRSNSSNTIQKNKIKKSSKVHKTAPIIIGASTRRASMPALAVDMIVTETDLHAHAMQSLSDNSFYGTCFVDLAGSAMARTDQ